jgi:hypothetical protein
MVSDRSHRERTINAEPPESCRLCADGHHFLCGAFTFTLLAILVVGSSSIRLSAQSMPADLVEFNGFYELVPVGTPLMGTHPAFGDPANVLVRSTEIQNKEPTEPALDPAKLCQPIGPFRMMALPGNKIQLIAGNDKLVMLFENVALGHYRTIYLNRDHPKLSIPTWEGDSIGHWHHGILTIDTVAFNLKTWLNGSGARHTASLHLLEQIRPILNGKFLEYKVTAEDSSALVASYTYIRYYKRVESEIQEDTCAEN